MPDWMAFQRAREEVSMLNPKDLQTITQMLQSQAAGQ